MKITSVIFYNVFMKNNAVFQTALSGVLTGVAIVVGWFGNFHVMGGNLNLIAIAIFIMPFFLKMQFSVLSAGISVVIVDLLNGWIAYSWISLVAYVGAVIIISLYRFIKLKFVYFVLVIIASLFIVGTYYFLELYSFGKSFAMKDLVTTAIEVSIATGVAMIIYLPLKIVAKVV